jgi:hypothetical protein
VAKAAAAPKKPPVPGLTAGPKVERLQRALRAADARDPRTGLPPAITARLDPPTINAINYWNQTVIGTTAPILSAKEITANLDKLTDAILKKSVPSTSKTWKPTSATSFKSTVQALPQGYVRSGDYVCGQGGCKPKTAGAKDKAQRLQVLLNQFPPATVAKYKNGARLETATGIIGPATAAAVTVVLRMNLDRGGGVVTFRSSTPETVSRDIDTVTRTVAAELALQAQAPSAPIPTPPPAVKKQIEQQGGGLAFQIIQSGRGQGNAVAVTKEWRCWVMALQAQCNRLGQKLVIDGTLGPNTASSVNEILQTTTYVPIRTLATDVKKYVGLVKDEADRKGAAPPPPAMMKLAKQKCMLETSAPVIDARWFAGVAINGGDGGVTPPPPTPTPDPKQPLPIPPNAKVQQLQALLNDFPPEVIARYANGTKVEVTGILSENDAAGVRAVMRSIRESRGMLPSPETETVTASWLAPRIESSLTQLKEWLPALRAFFAQGQSLPGPAPAPTPPGAPPPSPGRGHRRHRHAAGPGPMPGPAPSPMPPPPIPSPGDNKDMQQQEMLPQPPMKLTPLPGVTTDEEALLVQAAISAGLPPEEASAIVAAGRDDGRSVQEIEAMLKAALDSRTKQKTPMQIAGSPWWKVGLAALGAVATVGIGVGLYRAGRRQRQRPRDDSRTLPATP